MKFPNSQNSKLCINFNARVKEVKVCKVLKIEHQVIIISNHTRGLPTIVLGQIFHGTN